MRSSLPQHYNYISLWVGDCRVDGSGEKHAPQSLDEQVFAKKNRPALLQNGVETTLVEPGQHTHISGRLRAEVHIITQADVGEHDFDENHG